MFAFLNALTCIIALLYLLEQFRTFLILTNKKYRHLSRQKSRREP